MSGIWQHVTHKNPCPICKRTDWCTFGNRAMLCQRVASEHPNPKGGWYHFYGEDKPDYIPKAKAPPRSIDAFGMIRAWWVNTLPSKYDEQGKLLGVSHESLNLLGAAYAPQYNAWAFPMSDEEGNYCGIRLRNNSGFKWAVTGSRSGVFLPRNYVLIPRRVFLPEGPTDTAALLSLGLFAIGRPGANSGGEILSKLLRRLGVFEAVIVADNDELKKLGPRDGYPGIEGAEKLRKELGMRSVIWIPPSPLKDSREFVRRGGTRDMIESDIKNRIWAKR